MRPQVHTSSDILDGLATGDPAFLFSFIVRFEAPVIRSLRAAGVPDGRLDTTVHEVALVAAEIVRQAGPGDPESVVTDAIARVLSGELAEVLIPPAGGRALHLVDVENLAGGPDRAEHWLPTALHEYRAVAGVGVDDQVIAAADVTLWRRTAFDVAPWRYLPGYGPDGADLALLREAPPEYVAERFDRLVIGSGDHAFAPLAEAVADRGTEVVAVARPRQLSRALAEVATEVRPLPDLPVAA